MSETLEAAGERALYQRLLPGFLSATDQNAASYVLKGWLLTLLPSLALALAAGALFGVEQSGPEFGRSGPLLAFLLVVFAPVTETLLMTPPLLLLNRLFGASAAVALSAAGWGVLHSLAAPAWGLVVWWPFLVFSAVILIWRERGHTWRGMALVIAIHALQNAVPTVALFLSPA